MSDALSKHALHTSEFVNLVGIKFIGAWLREAKKIIEEEEEMADKYEEVDIHYESEISLPPFFRYIEAYIEQLKKELGF